MSDRLLSVEGLRVGDVVTVTVRLRNKDGSGGTYPWTRFCCVAALPKRKTASHATLLTLKMKPDLDRDLREVEFEMDHVTKLEPEHWPQGVIAMRMKHIATGLIKLD